MLHQFIGGNLKLRSVYHAHSSMKFHSDAVRENNKHNINPFGFRALTTFAGCYATYLMRFKATNSYSR